MGDQRPVLGAAPAPDPEGIRRERLQVDRALEAVSTALYRLNEAGERVREARHWWSAAAGPFGGGGMLLRRRMKESAGSAHLSLRTTDLALRDLRAELDRLHLVHVHEAPSTAGGEGDWLVSAWFEALFSEMLMNRRLRRAADRIEATAATVARLQSVLGRRRQVLEERLSAAEAAEAAQAAGEERVDRADPQVEARE